MILRSVIPFLESVEVSITVHTNAILTWMFGLLCCVSSLFTKAATASSVVESGSNPYSKHTTIKLSYYSLAGM